MMAVGDITVNPVIDSVVRRAPTAAYATTSNKDWAPHTSLLDSDGMLCLTLGAYLIRTRDRLVLVDAGIGPDSRTIARADTGHALRNSSVAAKYRANSLAGCSIGKLQPAPCCDVRLAGFRSSETAPICRCV